MTVLLSPNAKQKFDTLAGAPAAGYKLYTYATGTTTPLATYSNRAGTTPNANPIILDARGEATVYLTPGVVYDYKLTSGADVLEWTQAGVSAQAGDVGAINYTASGTGAVERALSAKLAEFVSVKDFGAVGDGVTDDTAAIQLALNASLKVHVPEGVYKLTATLNGRPGQIILGLAPERTQFQRNTAYGDTLVIGADVAVDNSDHAGAVRIEGIWFNHQYTFNNGSTYVAGTSTNITNKNPTASHVLITLGQNVRILDCWFYGLGYGVQFIDSYIMWIERCLFNGLWDSNVAGLQDSSAGVFCRASTSSLRCDDLHIAHCRIGGYGAGAASNVTTGSVTVSKTLNAGMRYGIWLESCERFDIADNYIGGQSKHNIYLSASAILAHGEIHDNMLDGAAEYSIRMDSNTASYFPNFISIHDNTGVGYGLDKGFVHIADTTQPRAATFVTIADNICQYYYRAPFRIEKAFGVTISGNTVAAYNSDNSVTSDPYVQAGCVVDTNCRSVNASGNVWGGGINDPTLTNYCKWGIYFYSTASGTAAHERSSGLGIAGGTVVGGMEQTYPTQTPLSHVSAGRSAAQSIPNGTATTVIWETEAYDNNGEYDTTTGIFTATQAGHYRVSACAKLAAAAYAVGNFAHLGLVQGGSLARTIRGPMNYVQAAATIEMAVGANGTFLLAAGDTLRCNLTHTQGGAVNVDANINYNNVSIDRLL